MKIAVLGNQPNWSLAELQRVAADRHIVEFVAWSQLTTRVGNGQQAGVAGRHYDAVVVRGMPVGTLEQVIFRMNALARWEAGGTTIINPARSLEISIDKYLSLALIAAAGIPVPETRVCQNVDDAMHAFEGLGGDAVIKPVFGGEGRGLVRVSDPELALRCFRAIINLDGIVYAQKFVAHGGFDIRLLVLGDEVLAMRRQNPADWRTNASRGATCHPCTADPADSGLALAAARATGSIVAGVDLLHDQGGQPLVLEVNGVPGWRHVAAATGIDVAAKVLECLESACAACD